MSFEHLILCHINKQYIFCMTHTYQVVEGSPWKACQTPFPPRPSLWLCADYFQLRRYRHRGNLNSLRSMSILVQQRCTTDRYSLLNECARCQKVWEVKREERSGEQIKDIELRRTFSPRRGESRKEQQGDYRLANYMRSNSIAALHHNSIFSSVLPLQPINTVKKSYWHWWKSGKK